MREFCAESEQNEAIMPEFLISTFVFAQDHMAAALSCQAQIAMAAVGWQLRSFS
jgi:hypothetical protein